jgi:hypothetical protein
MKRLKLIWLRAMEALGTSASNMASNAKFKVQEINLESRRREILTEFSTTAFDLWQKGQSLPTPLDTMLKELCDVDEKLSVVRAQKYAASVERRTNAEVNAPQAKPDEADPAAHDAPAEPISEAAEPALQEAAADTAEDPAAPEGDWTTEVSPENT